MASKYQKNIVSFGIVILLTTLHLGMQVIVEGLQTIDKSNFHPTPEGTIKTIEDPEDGDLIDCVDIYKQPSLKNPLIKDKTIQMRPSSSFIRTFNKTNSHPRKMIQNWHKYGECPKGTVPITRTRIYNDTFHRKYLYNDDPNSHEYAIATIIPGKYFGASAHFNVWNPKVTGSNEFSLSQLWLVTGRSTEPDRNSLEAGWIVFPDKFGGSKTRLFTFWTSDNFQRKRCYNEECKGFIHTNNKIRLGATIEPTSIYDRPDHQGILYIGLDKDKGFGNWWLTVDNEEVGYFSHEIFTRLKYAEEIIVGGEIINNKEGNRHTSTEMGSGHFSSEGFGKASYIHTVRGIDEKFQLFDADITYKQHISKPKCYDFKLARRGTSDKSNFFFGGPGHSDQCP